MKMIFGLSNSRGAQEKMQKQKDIKGKMMRLILEKIFISA
jgi:hypothetical protein